MFWSYPRTTSRPSSGLPAFLRLGLASALFAGICITQAHGADVSPDPAARAGTAKLVSGRVTVTDGSRERVLGPGDGVSARDTVSTGADGSASFVLRDGTVIVVGPSSKMELRAFAFDATTYRGNLVVGVLRGTMRMVSGLIRKTDPDAVSIETPTALIGIRGTDFIVDVEPSRDGT